jgi:hypothetical protein
MVACAGALLAAAAAFEQLQQQRRPALGNSSSGAGEGYMAGQWVCVCWILYRFPAPVTPVAQVLWFFLATLPAMLCYELRSALLLVCLCIECLC